MIRLAAAAYLLRPRLLLHFPAWFYGGFSLSQMATLEQEGEEVVGQARCPFESRQSNVGLFAGERGRPERPACTPSVCVCVCECLEGR